MTVEAEIGPVVDDNPIAVQCSTCYDNLSPGAALDFARYHGCLKSIAIEVGADPTFDSGKARRAVPAADDELIWDRADALRVL